ncbi:MAG: sporulation protein [Lewinellaceae bacterium]|nr:sporulation protein [Lewinellaceae bacterium]
MRTNFEELLPRVTDFLRSEAKTETVVGEPFLLGDFHCVPVIRVGMGFGSGAGEGDIAKRNSHGEGMGFAGGLGVEPIGFLVSRGEKVAFVPTKEPGALNAAFEKLPVLLEKFMEMRKENVLEPMHN